MDRPVLVGWSYGAAVAVHWADRNPGRRPMRSASSPPSTITRPAEQMTGKTTGDVTIGQALAFLGGGFRVFTWSVLEQEPVIR